MLQKIGLKFLFLLSFGFFVSCTSSEKDQVIRPKNIIFFVSDGMGFNHLKASNYYEHGVDKAQIFQQDEWVELAMATYSSIISIDNGDTLFSTGYNPQQANNDPGYFKLNYTDSGAAATALSTGNKTYNGSIGMGIYGDTLLHISTAAKNIGKAAGVVSSVHFTHATPAGFATHNQHRGNYAEIARSMLFDSRMDVIMGPGNPEYNNDGIQGTMNADLVGGLEIWNLLKANDNRTVFETNEGVYYVQDASGNGMSDAWTTVTTREEFQQLMEGETPQRILGVPQVHSTLQQGRTALGEEPLPFSTPNNNNVPTLQEMTKAALNVLAKNPNGFFVMIEGGAVDWASHQNNSVRMLEEQMDFNHSVAAAVEWVENYSNWDETLIIVTSDHECGYLTGPGEPNPVYGSAVNNGKGNIPGLQWNYGSHTNYLVPFYAKGAGAEMFQLMAGEFDPNYGPFIQNTDIATAVFFLWEIADKY